MVSIQEQVIVARVRYVLQEQWNANTKEYPECRGGIGMDSCDFSRLPLFAL